MSTIIKVNEIEYTIPTSWDDITVGQQIEISEVSGRDESFRNLHLVTTYTGIPLDLVKKMNINQFKSILKLMEFLSKPIKTTVIKNFNHNGKTYQLADSLLKGETQDFLSIEGILKKFKDNQTKALPYIIAIVCKKEGETLDSFDVWDRGEEFKTLPYSIAHNIWFFFVQTERALSINIKQFLEVQDKVLEASLSYSESILKKSDGRGLFSRLVKVYLMWYIRYTRKNFKIFLIGIPYETSNKNSNPESMKSKLSNLVKKVRDKFK